MTRVFTDHEAEGFYREIHAEAVHLAGGARDLPRRAVVYYHLYRASCGNFAFALIAAHGALWAYWYLAAARVVAWILSAFDLSSPLTPAQRLEAYDAYVRALLDIDRQVMIETYTVFHFTRRYGRHPSVRRAMPDMLLDQMMACHAAAGRNRHLPQAHKRALYETFLRWEQYRVVGPAIDAALAGFHWKLMRNLCLRPWVRLSYFRFGRWLGFRNLASVRERVDKGMRAFDCGAHAGWSGIERTLVASPFMPESFAADPDRCFDTLKHTRLDPLRKQAARMEARLFAQA